MLTNLVALQHADTAFPSGSFAFSNGVEGLMSLPERFDGDALRRYVEATLKHRWAGTDRPALVHAWRAGGTIARLAAIDAAIEAATLSDALRTGSRRAGRALLTTHLRLGTAGARALMDALTAADLLGHLATMQGALWRALGIGESDAAAMAGYQTISGLVGPAIRLGRIGAIEAQGVIRDMLPVLERILAVPLDEDRSLEFESFAPLADVASMRGAIDGIRLFSN